MKLVLQIHPSSKDLESYPSFLTFGPSTWCKFSNWQANEHQESLLETVFAGTEDFASFPPVEVWWKESTASWLPVQWCTVPGKGLQTSTHKVLRLLLWSWFFGWVYAFFLFFFFFFFLNILDLKDLLQSSHKLKAFARFHLKMETFFSEIRSQNNAFLKPLKLFRTS